jgi:hypothetical protein
MALQAQPWGSSPSAVGAHREKAKLPNPEEKKSVSSQRNPMHARVGSQI